MEITAWQMYWLTRLDGIVNVVTTIAVMGGFITVLAFVLSLMITDEFDIPIKSFLKKVVLPLSVVTALAGGALVFTPTTKQMVAIVVIPAIVNNTKAQAIPNKLLGLGSEWLDDLRPRKDEK